MILQNAIIRLLSMPMTQPFRTSMGVMDRKMGVIVELQSKLIHDVCAAWNVPVWVGGMFETGIGRAFHIALASLPNVSLPADMSPPSLYVPEDLVEPSFTVVACEIAVPQEPGLGYTVVPDRVGHDAIAETHVRDLMEA